MSDHHFTVVLNRISWLQPENSPRIEQLASGTTAKPPFPGKKTTTFNTVFCGICHAEAIKIISQVQSNLTLAAIDLPT